MKNRPYIIVLDKDNFFEIASRHHTVKWLSRHGFQRKPGKLTLAIPGPIDAGVPS